MTENTLDITPDPKVLVALTHTPLRPLDGLCELIDNAFDSFRAAKLQGHPEHHPLVEVHVPNANDVRRGDGLVRISDNGPGLDVAGLERAIRAGYSGNSNRYDNLGLFGMGFNIATGKLGRRSTVTTARRGDDFALRVVIHLPTVVKNRRFEVPVEKFPKPSGLSHGTIIEVSEWWPDGDANSGFILQLAKIAKDQLREQIGRRYATLLRSAAEDRIRLQVNAKAVAGFEHCVWADSRFVDRHGWGVIPARLNFNHIVASQLRCVADGTKVEPSAASCLECGGTEFRTIEERVKGWVGIQRFDDNDRFGIDLIRNGRAIRVSEKDAFFNYVDEIGQSVREYPTDQQSGRIVGEVQLDHVPVDFQKQDFQRSSEEWIAAMKYLRGGSLLPSKWTPDDRNETPVSRLFQGYRKVRNFGRGDMYMGIYDETAAKAVRIPRDTEKDLYDKFLNREEGFYDDAKWWEYVENASVPPLSKLEECPKCGYQNRPDVEKCQDCGEILLGKKCIGCGIEITRSAISCEHCGISQVPNVQEPWRCAVCHATNNIDDDQCSTCGKLRGTEHPCSEQVLRRDSVSVAELSFQGRSFRFVDGSNSEAIEVNAFKSSELKPRWDAASVPAVTLKSAGKIDVFVDAGHRLYAQLGVRLEETIAIEAAQYLYQAKSELIGKPGHSVHNLASELLFQIWGGHLVKGPEQVREEIRALFSRITERLVPTDAAADFYGELSSAEQTELANQLIRAGLLNQLTTLVDTGKYIQYAPPSILVRYFQHSPSSWFETVFSEHMPSPEVLGSATAEHVKTQLVGMYARCLDDCAAFLQYAQPDPLITTRARVSCDYLEGRLS